MNDDGHGEDGAGTTTLVRDGLQDEVQGGDQNIQNQNMNQNQNNAGTNLNQPQPANSNLNLNQVPGGPGTVSAPVQLLNATANGTNTGAVN